jgi:hypothetical protein
MTVDLAFALRAASFDPAKEARLYRNEAQHALILGEWGRAERCRDIALEWEEVLETARTAGIELVGESAGRLTA